MKAGLNFIVLAGGVEAARERLVGLEELIETVKAVEQHCFRRRRSLLLAQIRAPRYNPLLRCISPNAGRYRKIFL